VLKSQVALNELQPNSIDILMCSSIINKYINHPNQYESLSLAKGRQFPGITISLGGTTKNHHTLIF
jgi:hypothetical protein